jgi:hypothetical protein
VLSLQHPVLCWYLNRSSVLISPDGWGDSSFFFFLSFYSSCLVSSSLSEVWQFEFVYFPQVLENSSVAHQPSCFGVGFSLCWFIGGSFLCLIPFLWGHQPAPCCQHVMLVCWWFFNFAVLFDFGCCLLAQEMSFVDCSLPYFRQCLITHQLLALLPFQSLFTESSHGDQLLASPSFSGALTTPRPLCCMFLFSSLFIFSFFFCGVVPQSVQGAMLVYPKGGCGNTAWYLFAHLLVCWISQANLEPASGSMGALFA